MTPFRFPVEVFRNTEKRLIRYSLTVTDDVVKDHLSRCETEAVRRIEPDVHHLQPSTTIYVASLLLGLLPSGSCASHIASHIRSIVYLMHNAFECFPSLANQRRGALVGDRSVNPGSSMVHSTLDKGALRVSRTEESQVGQEQHPASLGEGKGRQDEAEQESKLERGDEIHAAVIVLLDELSNGLSERRLLGSGSWRSGRSRTRCILWWLQGGKQVGPGVCRDVEDGVHAEGQQSQGNLAGVQPHEGHSCRGFMSQRHLPGSWSLT
jgi:hypothetical protein